jgi:predicted NAD/FAD-binding protein
MTIGIIGSGISGLTAAYYLTQSGFDVRLFESENYVGGHTHTIPVSSGNKTYAVDTGFIVYNHQTYPHFCALLDEIGLTGEDTDMSFSVSDRVNHLEYAGGSFRGLFAQKRRLISPAFYLFLKNIYRTQQALKNALKTPEAAAQEILSTFMKRYNIDPQVIQYYLYPLISALWSSPLDAVEKMPVYFIAHFLENHGLLQMVPSLQWKVIPGGSSTYISPLIRHFSDKIYLNTTIEKIESTSEGIKLYANQALVGVFEKVIIATHSDQALALLDKPTPLEKKLLTGIPYQKNSVVLHKDKTLMPLNKNAWASWNYLIKPENTKQAVLTYYMNKLQNLTSSEDFFVTLNADNLIAPEKIIQTFDYYHPQFTQDSLIAQQHYRQLNQQGNIYFCGAYWGFGFHEDGVKSSLVVCEEITGRRFLYE